MEPLFGLAGLAEAGLAMEAGVLCIGVVAAFAATFVNLVLRSRIAAGIGTALWALLAVWLQPWRDFAPRPSDDPDMQSFQATFRSLAWWWAAASISSALAAVRAFWLGPRVRVPAGLFVPPPEWQMPFWMVAAAVAVGGLVCCCGILVWRC